MSEVVSGSIGKPPEIEKLFRDDPYLRQYESDILIRWKRMEKLRVRLEKHEGGLAKFAEGFKEYGVLQKENGDVVVSTRIKRLYPVVAQGKFIPTKIC